MKAKSESSLSKTPKQSLRTSDLIISDQKIKILNNLGQVIKGLQDNVVVNIEKLPKYYIDASLILDYLTTNKDNEVEEIPDRVVADSLVEIDWLEEMPIVNGLPIWERLDCEPIAEYRLFKKYRDIKKGVSRRSFDNLKKMTGVKVKALYGLSKVYHWQLRTKCYDKYRTSEIEKEKEKLVKLMETNHRAAAGKVFGTCMTYLKDIAEDGWYDAKGNLAVNPRDMIHWLELAVKLERLSLGLPGDKPVTKADRAKFERIEIGRIDSKTLNIESPNETQGSKKNYIQEVIDILDAAKALPKKIEAKGDMQKELESSENKHKP